MRITPSRFLTAVAGIVLTLSLSACGTGAHYSDAAAGSAIPNNFQLVEKSLSFTTTLDVVAGQTRYGTVKESAFRATTKLTYMDTSGKTLSTGQARFFATADTVDILDADGNHRSTLRENFWNSWGKAYTEYIVTDPSGRKLAESFKVQGLTTDFFLYDPSGKEIAKLHCPSFNFSGDVWNVTVIRPGEISVNDLVMIAAFKTAVDNQSD